MELNYTIERKKIPAEIGCQSLIGPGNERPCDWGNYFSFSNNGPRCVNMWAENLEDAVETEVPHRILEFKNILPDGMVEVDIITMGKRTWAVVVDERLPKNYLLDYPYFTGDYSMPVEMMKELEPKYNWNPDEMEKYYDPVSYYDKRGQIYETNDRFVSIRPKNPPETRILKCEYGSAVEDVGFFYCPYVPKMITVVGEGVAEELEKILKEEISKEFKDEFNKVKNSYYRKFKSKPETDEK